MERTTAAVGGAQALEGCGCYPLTHPDCCQSSLTTYTYTPHLAGS